MDRTTQKLIKKLQQGAAKANLWDSQPGTAKANAPKVNPRAGRYQSANDTFYNDKKNKLIAKTFGRLGDNDDDISFNAPTRAHARSLPGPRRYDSVDMAPPPPPPESESDEDDGDSPRTPSINSDRLEGFRSPTRLGLTKSRSFTPVGSKAERIRRALDAGDRKLARERARQSGVQSSGGRIKKRDSMPPPPPPPVEDLIEDNGSEAMGRLSNYSESSMDSPSVAAREDPGYHHRKPLSLSEYVQPADFVPPPPKDDPGVLPEATRRERLSTEDVIPPPPPDTDNDDDDNDDGRDSPKARHKHQKKPHRPHPHSHGASSSSLPSSRRAKREKKKDGSPRKNRNVRIAPLDTTTRSSRFKQGSKGSSHDRKGSDRRSEALLSQPPGHKYSDQRAKILPHVSMLSPQSTVEPFALPDIPSKKSLKSYTPKALVDAEAYIRGLKEEARRKKEEAGKSSGNEAASELQRMTDAYIEGGEAFHILIHALAHKPKMVSTKIDRNLEQTCRFAVCLNKLLNAEIEHSGMVSAVVSTERITEANIEQDVAPDDTHMWKPILERLEEVSMKRRDQAEKLSEFLNRFIEKLRLSQAQLAKNVLTLERRKAQWDETHNLVIEKNMDCMGDYQALKVATSLVTQSGCTLDDLELEYSKGSHPLIDVLKGEGRSNSETKGRQRAEKIQAKHIHLKVKKGVKIKKGLAAIAKKIEKPLQKAIESFQEYAAMIDDGNKTYKACWELNHGLPAILEEVGCIECRRYEGLGRLVSFVERLARNSHVPTWLKTMLGYLRKLHTRLGLTDWVYEQVVAHGLSEAKKPNKFQYNLPCTIEDMVLLQWSEEYSQYKNSVYVSKQLYRAQQPEECNSNKNDLVFVESKRAERKGFWNVEILTGPHRHESGLLPSSVLKLATPSSSMKLIHMLRISAGRQIFSEHVQEEMSNENLDFWLSVEQYRTISQEENRGRRARNIMNRFIFDSAEQQININAIHRKKIQKRFGENEFTRDLFDCAQTEIYELMRKDSYSRFKEKKEFKQFLEHFK